MFKIHSLIILHKITHFILFKSKKYRTYYMVLFKQSPYMINCIFF